MAERHRVLHHSMLAALCGILAGAGPAPQGPGYTIAFKSFAPNNADVFIADGDGRNARALMPDPTQDYDASFSADGWVMDLDTKKTHDVTNHPAGDFRPVWSPDKRWIAFSSDRGATRGACPQTTQLGPAAFVTPRARRAMCGEAAAVGHVPPSRQSVSRRLPRQRTPTGPIPGSNVPEHDGRVALQPAQRVAVRAPISRGQSRAVREGCAARGR